MQRQKESSRPSGNGGALIVDSNCGDWDEEDAVDHEENYSGDDYGEEVEDEEISDALAEMLELKGERLEAFVQKKQEEVSMLQDRYLSRLGYVKRRGASRR